MISCVVRGTVLSLVALQQGGMPEGSSEAVEFGVIVAVSLAVIRFAEWILNRYVPAKNGVDGRLREMTERQERILTAIRDSTNATERIAVTVAAIVQEDKDRERQERVRERERERVAMLLQQIHAKVHAA